MDFISLQEPNGNTIYFNPAQIVAVEIRDHSGTIIHANGRKYDIKQEFDVVKQLLKNRGYII